MSSQAQAQDLHKTSKSGLEKLLWDQPRREPWKEAFWSRERLECLSETGPSSLSTSMRGVPCTAAGTGRNEWPSRWEDAGTTRITNHDDLHPSYSCTAAVELSYLSNTHRFRSRVNEGQISHIYTSAHRTVHPEHTNQTFSLQELLLITCTNKADAAKSSPLSQ